VIAAHAKARSRALRNRQEFGVGRPFTRSEFNRVYCQEYPDRLSAPLPSHYCVNLNPKLAEGCPKFLRWLGRGRYEFTGELCYGAAQLFTGDAERASF
jgi:hypothetical protein